jgi:hypothetical protein
MQRREFIAGLSSAAAWPVVAGAQQGDRIRRGINVGEQPSMLIAQDLQPSLSDL